MAIRVVMLRDFVGPAAICIVEGGPVLATADVPGMSEYTVSAGEMYDFEAVADWRANGAEVEIINSEE